MIYLPRPDYFEGILQLRDCSQEIVDWVCETTEKDGKAAITKDKKVKGGRDLYFSSQKYLKALGKKLKERFPGIMKTSATLHTKSKTGEDLYRVTILFRFLPFKKGDVIELKGEEVEILTIGKHARVKNVNTGKKENISLEEIARARR